MAARFSLPKIYPITDPELSGLFHLEQVKALIQSGAQLVQIRDKTSSSREFFEAARACLEFCRSQNVKLIINDRVDIAMILKADGVHLGQDDVPPVEARKLLGESALIGFSTHTIEQAIDAIKMPIDYIAFGPVFQTSTKADHDPVVGLQHLTTVRQAIGQFPMVAIGGIGLSNAVESLKAGADSAAMISAIVGDPRKIAENMRAAIQITLDC